MGSDCKQTVSQCDRNRFLIQVDLCTALGAGLYWVWKNCSYYQIFRQAAHGFGRGFEDSCTTSPALQCINLQKTQHVQKLMNKQDGRNDHA